MFSQISNLKSSLGLQISQLLLAAVPASTTVTTAADIVALAAGL